MIVGSVVTGGLTVSQMTLGNHEFDYSLDTLAAFVDGIKAKTPVISSNIEVRLRLLCDDEYGQAQCVCLFPKLLVCLIKRSAYFRDLHLTGSLAQLAAGNVLEGKINPGGKGYIVKEYAQGDGTTVKVGIIGATTPETKTLTSPLSTEGVMFNDVATSVQAAVDELEAEGVNILIALTHQGYEEDTALAAAVPKLDVIVGGHSHSFLYSQADDKPTWSIEGGNAFTGHTVAGPYPTTVSVNSGVKEVLVVTAYTASFYLGHLNVQFDGNGDVIRHGGNPVPLFGMLPEDSSAFEGVEEDAGMVALIAPGLAEIDAKEAEKVCPCCKETDWV